MNFSVVRSPARVCWWVMCNGKLLSTAETKNEALGQADYYRRKYAQLVRYFSSTCILTLFLI